MSKTQPETTTEQEIEHVARAMATAMGHNPDETLRVEYGGFHLQFGPYWQMQREWAIRLIAGLQALQKFREDRAQPETTTQAKADYFAKVGNAGSSTDLKIDIVGELASFPSTYLAWGRVALHALIITATFAAIIMGATWPALLAGAGFTWMVNREGDE